MHYKKTKTPKIHSGSFYLTEQTLEVLNFIAELENISRSLIIENALISAFKGFKNGEKKKKKIYPKAKHNQKNRKNKQTKKYIQKCLFA